MMDEREPTPENFGRYVGGLFAREDEALSAARAEMEREGLPKINVSASEGTLLHILARAVGARRILEIGTLGGYSATWLARALPEDGRLISLEIDEHHADVARRNLARAGLSEKVEVRVGPAAESLDTLAASGEDAFDLVFIDADKDGYPTYLEKSVPLVRAGGLIVADNVLQPAVLDPDADTGITRYNAALAARPDLVSIITPTLGRGLGGLSISVKRSAAS
jgi:predicted O-methyltransferase YrrM